MSLRRLFHTHTHTNEQVKNFLPFASCLTLLSLCAVLTPPSSPLYPSFGKFVSWNRGEQFVLFLENYFLPPLPCPFENSAKFRNRGKLFLSYFIIYLFLKIFREEFWENYFFRGKFCFLFQCLFIFRKISRKRRIIGLARNCQKIETIIVEEVFFIWGERFWRWKLVSNLISLFRRGKN